jgi:hypothetical protein
MTNPVKPHELSPTVPNAVIDAVNHILAEKCRDMDKPIMIRQDEIIERIQHNDHTLTREIIFEKKYLDFEKVYESMGWEVEYTKPDYTERSFPSYFTFKAKK